jgi:hypothetical protein
MSTLSGHTDSLSLQPAELLAPLLEAFVRAFDGSVTLPAAGYHYGVNWVISTDGTLTRWNGS